LSTPAASFRNAPPFAIMMGDLQQDEEMMGDQPQQDEEEEASTPATMHQSKIVKEIMGKVVAENRQLIMLVRMLHLPCLFMRKMKS
jgi:hypothetical protein